MPDRSDLKAALERRGTSQAQASPAQNNLIALLRDERVKQQLAVALPKHISVDRLLRVVLTEIRRNPQLARCDQQSFLGSLMLSAQLGLEPGGALGHAYLVPYRRQGRYECQLIIGYRGLIELARRSGQISSIEARAVYEGDRFECAFGLEPRLVHEPRWDNPDRANPERLVYVYAIARMRDGGVQYEVMSRREILAVRAQSRAEAGPWQTHFTEMALKTVLRRLAKLLPMSIEMAEAIDVEERADQDAALPTDIPVITAPQSAEPEPPGQDEEHEREHEHEHEQEQEQEKEA